MEYDFILHPLLSLCVSMCDCMYMCEWLCECVCTCDYVCKFTCACSYHSTYVEVRGNLQYLVLPFHHVGSEDWQQTILPAEPPHWPRFLVLAENYRRALVRKDVLLSSQGKSAASPLLSFLRFKWNKFQFFFLFFCFTSFLPCFIFYFSLLNLSDVDFCFLSKLFRRMLYCLFVLIQVFRATQFLI